MGSIFSYVAYGLNVCSALPLPELLAAGAKDAEKEADVTICFEEVGPLPRAAAAEGCFSATAEETYLYWEDVGKFLVQEGRRIVVEPAPRVEERMLRLFILGPVLAALLYQRGQLVLHASMRLL